MTRLFSTPRTRTWLFGLAIMAATVAAYWPALHGGFLFDDGVHISENESLRSAHGLWEIWFVPGATFQYYPLTFTGFWIGYHLWGLNTLGYHLVNVLLHGTGAILLWQILARLKVRGAWLAGAIFALHPVCVMSVAWMTELKNTLSGTLALGAGWAYLRAAGLGVYGEGKEAGRLDWRFYALALGLFQLAMFAKTAVSFLPVTLLLVTWWCGRRLNWRAIWPVLPMFGIAVAMGLLTIHVEHSEKGGATGSGFQMTLLERVLVSGRSFWFYLGKLVYPHQLAFIYERWAVDAKVWWQYIYPMAMLALLGGLWRLRGTAKGLLVALLCFYVSTSLLILIVVPYFTLFSYVSDHWQYFGCPAVMAVMAVGITWVLEHLGRPRPILGLIVCGALLLILGAMTRGQCKIYRDSKTLWSATVIRSPNSSLARNNLGAIYLHEGDVDKALWHLQKAVAVQPGYAEAHYNLGNALVRKGDLDAGIVEFQRSLAIRPGDSPAHNNLGSAYLRKGRMEEAVAEYREAVRLKPELASVHSNLGNALLQMGHTDQAITELQAVAKLRPDSAEVRFDLGNAWLQSRRVAEAVAEWQSALKIRPDYMDAQGGLIRIAWLLATCPDGAVRNGAMAVELAELVTSLPGGVNPQNLGALAAAYAEAGRFTEAAGAAERARQLAEQAGSAALAGALKEQIALYHASQPFRDTNQALAVPDPARH